MGNILFNRDANSIEAVENLSWGRSYGNGRVPLPFQSAEISSELLQYLRLNCVIFSASEAGLQANASFERCVDHPELPRHRYYEGYFHAQATSMPVKSLNPRLGYEMEKAAAPRPMRALCEALRRKLNPILIEALSDAKGEMAALVVSKLEQGLAFSDLAVQVHAGGAVPETSVGWHTDAPNSVLHLALSIGRGGRCLHSRRCFKGSSEEELTEHVVQRQREGAVYLSSPACFEHGVSYDGALLWSNRIIAVQCRFPIGKERDLLNPFSGEDFIELMQCLAKGINGTSNTGGGGAEESPSVTPFVMPTLNEVVAVEKDLARAEEKEQVLSAVRNHP